MKIAIGKDPLVKNLSRVQNIVGRKSTMPILSNVLLEGEGKTLTVSATDLEVSLRSQLAANVARGGRICVNARTLFEIVKELPTDDVTLSQEKEGYLFIESGKAHFQILTVNPDEFPQLPSDKVAEKGASLAAATIHDMIHKIHYAMSSDEMRYNLNGVYVENISEGGKRVLRMVATDGHRLALIDRPLEGKKFEIKSSAILPRKGVMEIRSLLEGYEGEVQFTIQDSNAILRAGETTLFMRLISGEYPNYKQVIPTDNNKRLVVGKEQLHGTLKRVSVLSGSKTKCVKFDLRAGAAELSCSNPEMGDAREEIPVNYEGDPLCIGFNARYFMDVLEVAGEKNVRVEMKTELSPGLVKIEGDEDFLAAVMPMRI
jgi:DNA polymerase III subunit beta